MNAPTARRRRVSLLLVGMLVVATLASLAGCGGAETGGQRWHCPMHPTYIADRPGDCPICGMRLVPMAEQTAAPAPGGEAAAPAAAGERTVRFYRHPMNPAVTSPVPAQDEMGMDYVPVYEGEVAAAETPVRGLGTVVTDQPGLALAGVQTAEARRETLGRSVRTVGLIVPDERRVRHVHTKIAGWIEHLHANFTGQQVRRGEPLLAIYSPELLATQEEFLRARESAARFASSQIPEVRRGGEDLLEAARRRLQLFDVPPSFIAELERSGRPRRTVTLAAPVSGFVTAKEVFEGQQIEPGMELYTITDLSQVWIEADFYEFEARALRVGQSATLQLPYDPQFRRAGRVTFIYPTVDPASRTLKVRLEFANPDGQLRPGMYADVVAELDEREGIVVPDSAVLDSGLRQIVFVEREPGVFEPREVRVATRADGRALLVSGVRAGERVATRANFLLDSESRLRAAIAAARQGGAGAAGHDHGAEAESEAER